MVDRQLRVLAEATDQIATEPAAALARECRDDRSRRPARRSRSARAAVYGSGCTTCPCASMPSPRRTLSARRSRRSASSCSSSSLCGETIRKLAGLCAARLRMRSSSSSERTVWFAITSTFASPTPCSAVTTTCAHGQPTRRAPDLADDVAPQPARLLRAVGRDDDLVDRRLELGERVLHGLHGPRLDDEALCRAHRTRAAPSASARDAGPRRPGACPRTRRNPGSAR